VTDNGRNSGRRDADGAVEGRGSATFTAESMAVILSDACHAVGLDASGARLMRLGSNAVYRLVAPVVVHVARPGGSAEVGRIIDVARWLAAADYPAVRALDVDQPVVVDGLAVTFWETVSRDGDTYAPVRDVARLLVWLHSLTVPYELELPEFDPFDGIAQRIDTNGSLGEEDRAFLATRLDKLRERYAGLDFVLPRGVIHGDANVGNVLLDDRGEAVVIDLDGVAFGPREWDLIQTAIFYDRFGWHTREEYEGFVEVYGFDIMSWPGYGVLGDIRELHMVAWLVQGAADSERMADEARKRIMSLRTGSSRRDWLPY
jgi:Ser/Thr protein kinase RdoA (MazF antagonist)